MRFSLLPRLSLGLALLAPLTAQTDIPAEITVDPDTGLKKVRWPAYEGNTYYLQTSPDLIHWTVIPSYVIGEDVLAGMEIDGPSPLFARVISVQGLPTDDNDSDGLNNHEEIVTSSTNPDNADSDGDGATDLEEMVANTDPNDTASGPAFVVEVRYEPDDYPLRLYLDENRGLLGHNSGIPPILAGTVSLDDPEDSKTWQIDLWDDTNTRTVLVDFRAFPSVDSSNTLSLLNIRESSIDDAIDVDVLNLEITAPADQAPQESGLNDPLPTKGGYGDWILLPVELTAHKRGTIDSPGEAIPRGGGDEIYEVVTLENADYDETDWQPSSMSDGGLEDKQDGKTDTVSKDKDDDFVKLHLSCPLSDVGGSSEIVFDQPGVDDRMQESDIRFYNGDGERIQLSELEIDDLKNPSGPLQPAFGDGGLDLFLEIGDLGEMTGQKSEADEMERKYADLVWKILIGGETIEQKVRIFRGGFWRADRTDNTGTIALYDGKGENDDGTVDFGQIVKGPYQIKTGQEGQPDETVPNSGPTPMGWYGLYARNRGGNNTDMRTWWTPKGARPQTNHHLDKNDAFLGYVQQGSYCQWSQAGNHNIVGKGAYGYDNEDDSDRYDGMPDSIHFKFELVEIGEFTTRTYLQVHPDGYCDGTAGCLGLQTYDDCCKVLFLMRHYFQTRLLVD